MTPAQARKALDNYRANLGPAILRGLRRGIRKAEALSKTSYMVRLGPRDRPYPPPGPLGIRTGRLARTVQATEPRWDGTAWTASLRAGSTEVRYAGIHERSGWAGREMRSFVPARPYLAPAIRAADIEGAVRFELVALQRATLRGLIRGT